MSVLGQLMPHTVPLLSPSDLGISRHDGPPSRHQPTAPTILHARKDINDSGKEPNE